MQRRAFLKQTALGAAGSAVLAAPAIAQEAPPLTWRLTSDFPAESATLYAGATDVARHVAAVTDGRFNIEVFPAGQLFQSGQALEAVQHRIVECGHAASTRYFTTDPALCFDGGVPFGLNTRQMNAWMKQGDGLALTREAFAKYDILNFPCGYTGAQMGGWFRGEIKTVDDLRGLKVAAVGFAGDILSRLGATPVDVPAIDLHAALAQGVVDGAATTGPLDDERLALFDVARNYYFPGWWAGTQQLSLYVNEDAYNELPKSYQTALSLACAAASDAMIAAFDANNPDALRRLVSQGAQLKAYPRPVLQAAHAATQAACTEFGAKDAMFKKLSDSMLAFRSKQVPWFRMAEGGFDNMVATLGAPGA